MADRGILVTVLHSAYPLALPLDGPIASGSPAGPAKSIAMDVLARRLALEFDHAENLIASPCHGTISGTVKNGGTAVAGAVVMLFHRRTALVVDRAVSSATGTFSFSSLYQATNAYFAIAFDPDTGDLLDALIHDHLTPA